MDVLRISIGIPAWLAERVNQRAGSVVRAVGMRTHQINTDLARYYEILDHANTNLTVFFKDEDVEELAGKLGHLSFGSSVEIRSIPQEAERRGANKLMMARLEALSFAELVALADLIEQRYRRERGV